MIILAAAFGLHHELGQESGIPLWNLPDEYARFRKSITGHPIIMGRKSYDAVKEPIPGSLNIIITRKKHYDAKGAAIAHSVEEALSKAASSDADIYITGGGEIFKEAIQIADKMEISVIDATFPGATAFFPEFFREEWQLNASEKHGKDVRHTYSFTFQIWTKK